MNDQKLTAIPLFAGLSKRERRELAKHTDEVDIPEGRKLACEGDYAYEFFVIEEGTAEVRRNGKHIADLRAGDFAGEMGVLSNKRRNATIIATSPMTVIVMSGHEFRAIERTLPGVGARVRAVADERALVLV